MAMLTIEEMLRKGFVADGIARVHNVPVVEVLEIQHKLAYGTDKPKDVVDPRLTKEQLANKIGEALGVPGGQFLPATKVGLVNLLVLVKTSKIELSEPKKKGTKDDIIGYLCQNFDKDFSGLKACNKPTLELLSQITRLI